MHRRSGMFNKWNERRIHVHTIFKIEMHNRLMKISLACVDFFFCFVYAIDDDDDDDITTTTLSWDQIPVENERHNNHLHYHTMSFIVSYVHANPQMFLSHWQIFIIFFYSFSSFRTLHCMQSKTHSNI